MSSYPRLGSAAPAFTAPAIGGPYGSPADVSLADFAGETVVLYFYPKDGTPGCTRQACTIRDGWADLSAKAKVFGISVNSVGSHLKFIAKHQLPFPILSDVDHRIASAYGVWVEKSMYGKTYFGTERSTFIIAPDGTLKAILPKVKPEQHHQQLLEVLEGK